MLPVGVNFMRPITYISIILLFVSCTTDYKKTLIGEWYKTDKWINTGNFNSIPQLSNEPRPPMYYPFGQEFFANDSVEYLLGVWQKTDQGRNYLGQYRLYKIKDDSLFIYELDNVLRHRLKMEFKGDDTLILYKNDTKTTFVRFNSETLKHINIDSIRIIQSNGWGLHIEYKVSKNGNIVYRNKSIEKEAIDISKTGNISREDFRYIELKYQSSDFINLSDYGGCCDSYSFKTTIYYNEKKVKQIYDYENSSPMKFIWANRYLMSIIESNLEIKN